MLWLCHLLSATLTRLVTLSWHILSIPLLCLCLSLASLSFTYLGTKACTALCLSSPQGTRDPTCDLGADPLIFWPRQHHRQDLISLLSISAPLPPPPLSFLPPPLPSSTPPPALGSAFPLFPSGNDSHICLPPASPASQTFIVRGRAGAFQPSEASGLWQAVGGAPVGSMFFPAALPAPGPSRRCVALTGSMEGVQLLS